MSISTNPSRSIRDWEVSGEKKILDDLLKEAICDQDLDITNCDREPIHVPNSIQSFGALIVFDPHTLKLLQLSKNLEQWTGLSLDTLCDQNLHACLSAQTIQKIRRILSTAPAGASSQLPLELLHGDHGSYLSCIGQLHQESTYCCLEIENFGSESLNYFKFYDELKVPIQEIQQTRSLKELYSTTVNIIREIIGYDRVLIYKFMPDQSGHVVAEALGENLPSYLGLRYPATDIPLQARILYTINSMRIIPDVAYEPVPILNCSPNLPYQTLDMSKIGVRSVSPIHLEYLTNMGVKASFSVSILNDGQLWGLIACHHHSEPKNISLNVRSICDFIGQVVSSELILKERNEFLRRKIKQKAVLQSFSNDMLKFDSLSDLFTHKSNELLQMVDASGAVLIEQETVFLFGITPTEDEILPVYDAIKPQFRDVSIVSISSINDSIPNCQLLSSDVAGLLGLSISEPQQIALFWFRPAVSRTVKWAGKPEKEEFVDDSGDRYLSPRQSFELWEQTVSGHCEPWTSVEIEMAQQLRNGMVSLFLKKVYDLSELNLELSRSNEDFSSLAYAASHDLKSPLRSIAHLVRWLEEDLNEHLNEETRDYIQEILANVSRMNDLIMALIDFLQAGSLGNEESVISVSEVIRDVIRYISTPKSIKFNYPQDELIYRTNPRLLSQVLSNLVDNAVKYLDRQDGQISINVLPGKKLLTFEVRDNGPGIDPSLHHRIYDMFWTLDRSDSRQNTGMGLAIVKKIIERQGGQIDVQSSLGNGSNFKFTWPVAE